MNREELEIKKVFAGIAKNLSKKKLSQISCTLRLYSFDFLKTKFLIFSNSI